MGTKTKALKLRFKEVDGVSDDGEIYAWGNISNVVDYNNELVETGAYQATLDFHEDEGTSIKMLYQHDPDRVIGVWDEYGVSEIDGKEGFWVKGRINLDIPLGKEVHSNLKMGALDSLSIGYLVLDEYKGNDGVIHLKSIIINETSIVTFPANAASKIISIKNRLEQEKQEVVEPEIQKVSINSWEDIKRKSRMKSILEQIRSK
ncbi:HK97 family phage prohead protease [Aeromonas rivipollensis]|uniref:HK97 family phage prohead protease n=1 Tax=Aeromonas rivipollensis TaxID=948519 RepID=A0ABX0CYN2_9GAMM|nr:HK97 family phage prohead protease [Aeromonas rivipollensis]NEX88884.1 HK97 family phage prohead protease [Aeromonas rivipollensis]NEY06988.1 HK97 family phage prohead protease [Aeromonas rivipollensis]